MRAALCVALLAACDWELSRMSDQPRCEPGDVTDWLPDRRCDQEPPAGTVPWRSSVGEAQPRTTRALIERGADRFARFCSACHGVLGDGRSAVAADMTLRRPPSLHEPRIIAYDDRRLADVIARGYGVMPAYGYVLPPADRWAVTAYVRVLQLSQNVALGDLEDTQRQEATRWLP
jgi:mono/diheme cytochrome c family protein